MSHPLAQQCYTEGFQRRLEGLVKQAISPRVATTAATMAGGRGAEMVSRGRTLEAILDNPNTGAWTNTIKRWTAPYGMLDHLKTHRADYAHAHATTQALHDAALAAGDHAGATAAADQLKHIKNIFTQREEELFNQLGTASEPRRKLVEVGLPMAAGGAAIGTAAGGGAYLYGKDQARKDTLGEVGDATFMERLKMLTMPKQTIAQKLFGPSNPPHQ